MNLAYLAYPLAAIVALLGYKAGALSLSGAAAACVVGGTVLGFGGWGWAVLMGLFFTLSSALSFFKRSDARKRRAAEAFDKGGRRDAAQVLANGGVAALLALLSASAPLNMVVALFCAYTGSLAAATADTWATEVGTLSRHAPRLITTGRAVAPGTSGGVTWLGSGASLAGALFIGAAAALLACNSIFSSFTYTVGREANPLGFLLAGLAGGVSGSLADSLLGATVQASYHCPHCDKPTESRVHKCGIQTHLARGVRWITNDAINLSATLVGAAVGGALGGVLYN